MMQSSFIGICIMSKPIFHFLLMALAMVFSSPSAAVNLNPESPSAAPNPLLPFDRLIGGSWQLGNSTSEFEWGVGKRSVRGRSYLTIEGERILVSEGSWYWHPGSKQIRGSFTAINMPVVLFEYTTGFEGDTLFHDLLSYDQAGTEFRYLETWQFTDDSHYVWTLFEKTDDGNVEQMNAIYEKVDD